MIKLSAKRTLYNDYQETEEHWIKTIPSTWSLKRLQFGASFRNSGIDKKIIEGEESIRLCNYVDVYYHDVIDDSIDFMIGSATKEEIDAFRLRKGDVIMTKDSESPDDIGIPAYVAKDFEDVVCGYHLCVLKTFPDQLDPKFLFYFLKSNLAQAWFEIYSNGVTRFGLSYTGIKTLQIPHPPISEQQSIAKFLDEKTKQIDDLIEQKEKLLKLLTKKRTAIITQAVTKGLAPKVEMKDSGIEWLGEVPAKWKPLRMKFVTSYIGSGKTPKGGSQVYLDEGIMLLRSQNVHNDGLRLDDVVFINEEMEKKLQNSKIKPFDVLLNITGASLGRSFFIPDQFPLANVNQHVCIIRPIEERIHHRFLHFFLTSSIGKSQIESYENGSSREGLNFQQIADMFICIPQIDEQLKIVTYLSEVVQKIDEAIGSIEKSVFHLKEYRSSLITSTVTGQIDVRKEVVA